MRVFLAVGASLILTCAFVAMVGSEGEVVLESDAQLVEQKEHAAARIDELNALQEVIHKAMEKPTPENIQAAMAAQKQLSGGALPAMPAAAQMPVVEEKQEAPPHTTQSTRQLEKKEQSGVHRISELEKMKAIVKKAEEDPTPENIQAAMAAQRHLAEKPASQPTIVSDASQVADLINSREAQQPHLQAEAAEKTAAPAKAESDSALKSQKAHAQSDIDQLNNLKEVIKKAMTDPSDANIKAAMDAQKQLQALSHKQVSPAPQAAPPAPEAAPAAPTEATETSGPLEHTNKKQVDVTGFTKVTHAHLAHGQHHLAAKEKKGVTRINQLEQLKAVVRRAMKNPTPENVQAAMDAEAEMKKGAAGAGKEQAPQPETDEKESAPTPAAKVEFNLDIDNLGKIEVHKGDKAIDLAKAFAKEHSLSDAMAKKLESMIQGQMKAHNIM